MLAKLSPNENTSALHRCVVDSLYIIYWFFFSLRWAYSSLKLMALTAERFLSGGHVSWHTAGETPREMVRWISPEDIGCRRAKNVQREEYWGSSMSRSGRLLFDMNMMLVSVCVFIILLLYLCSNYPPCITAYLQICLNCHRNQIKGVYQLLAN